MNDLSRGPVGALFITGLRNAHAIENEALSIMRPQVERLERYPEMRERLRMHIGETEAQITRLEEVLSNLGESHSSFKDTAASLMGSMAAMGHTVAGDEILKNSFANYAFENYEIAAYRSLLTMADVGGLTQAIPLINQNLREEEAMAGWLEDHLEMITRRYIALEEAGETSKR